MLGKASPLIWPLREKLFNPVMLQQRPRVTGGRRVITLPVLPWDDADRPPVISYGRVDKPPILAANVWVGFGLCATGAVAWPLNAFKQPPYLSSFSEQRFEPAVVHALKPMPATYYTVSASTKTGTGTTLGSCQVGLFKTPSGNRIDTKTSDASTGAVEFRSASPTGSHFMVAYLIGSPDKAGTTVNTLVPGSTVNIFLRDPTIADSSGGGGTSLFIVNE